jgi:hypothetical protein
MIASPCKDCEKRACSKESCADSCKKLQKIQAYQAMANDGYPYAAVDCTSEDRYCVAIPPIR